jgi:hypothetical protein
MVFHYGLGLPQYFNDLGVCRAAFCLPLLVLLVLVLNEGQNE